MCQSKLFVIVYLHSLTIAFFRGTIYLKKKDLENIKQVLNTHIRQIVNILHSLK